MFSNPDNGSNWQSDSLPRSGETANSLVGAIEALCAALGRPVQSVAADGKIAIVIEPSPAEWQAVVECLGRCGSSSQAVASARVQPIEILVAEDDPVTMSLLRKILARDPAFRVSTVKDGKAAWEQLDRGAPVDLCVLDIMMPEMNGLDLLKRMREDARFQSLDVVLCTAVHEREAVEKAAALKAHYLLKPFSAQVLLDRVYAVVKHRHDRANSVRQRLGIDFDTYLDLLSSLADDVLTTLSSVRSDLLRGDRWAASARLTGLKGAGLSIGDEGLVSAALQAESAILARSMEEVMTSLERLELESRRIRQTARKLSHLAAAPGQQGKPNEALQWAARLLRGNAPERPSVN